MAQAVARFEEGGFDIIAGRSGSGNLASLPPSRLVTLRSELHNVAQAYDSVVLDLGAGIERAVRVLVGKVRTCLVVATDEPTSITDAYAFIKVTALDHLVDDIRIIVNMAANKFADGALKDQGAIDLIKQQLAAFGKFIDRVKVG